MKSATYGNRKKKDPILDLIKMHDLILGFIEKADQLWGVADNRAPLLKVEKGVIRLSKNRFDEVPQLDPLYRYFRRLILEAQAGNRSALYELKTYILELRETWIQARKLYNKKKAV